MRLLSSLAIFATLSIPVAAFATPITISSTGSGLTSGSTDTHWTVTTPVSGPVSATASTAHPAWHPETSGTGTQWINDTGIANASSNELSGVYTYTTTFSLAGLQSSTASLGINYFIDDTLIGIFLNGVQVSGCSGGSFSGTASTCNITSANGAFNGGNNVLSIEVHNTGGPTGLFADVSGSATVTPPVPEPSSMALLGTGILSLAGFARRKAKA